MVNETSLFAPEEFLQVPPTLACAIGLNEAIVAQRIYWLLKYPQNGKEVDGHRWIYNSYSEWRKQFFPFWSEDTIKRIFISLECRGIIASCQPEGSNRRKYYRVTESAKKSLTKERLESFPSGQIAPAPSVQNALMEEGRLPRCYIYRESPAKSQRTKSQNIPKGNSTDDKNLPDEKFDFSKQQEDLMIKLRETNQGEPDSFPQQPITDDEE